MIATTTISVHRDVTATAFGDEADDNTDPITSAVPASLTETSRKVYSPADGRVQTVRYVTCRVRPGVTVAVGDRVIDERTSDVYHVDSVHQVQGIGYTADIVLDLTRI